MDFNSSSNSCVKIQDHIFDYVDLAPVQAGFGVGYSALFLLGFAANCATLRCLVSFGGGGGGAWTENGSGNGSARRKMKFGVSLGFLISLSLADLLLIACTSLPLTAVHIFTRRWLLGEFACKFGPFLQGVGCFVTSFSLTAIAVERYSMIAAGVAGSKRAGPTLSLCVVGAIWILAAAVAAPLASAYQLRRECLEEVGCFCGEFCDEIGWTSDWNRTVYGSAAFVLQYVLPASVLAFCYCKVRQRVDLSVQKRLQRERMSLLTQERLSQRKTRTSRMTLLLFAGFACPWLPMWVMNLLRDFNHLPQDWYAVAFAGGHLIAMTTMLWNPIVYCWANRNFRSAFVSALFCRRIAFANPTPNDDDECEYATATRTANSGRTNLSAFERSFRSGRSSSHSSGRRSRLDTCSSVQSPAYNRPRPNSWQHDSSQMNLTVLQSGRATSLLSTGSTLDVEPMIF